MQLEDERRGLPEPPQAHGETVLVERPRRHVVEISARRTSSRIAEHIEEALVSAGHAERAARERAYLKSDLRHLGVRVPEIRRITRSALRSEGIEGRDEALSLTDRLWSRPFHEMRMAAVEVLVARADLLRAKDMDALERYIRQSKTWALVDGLAASVVGAVIVNDSSALKRLDDWAKDDDFWVRRAAMLSLLKPLRAGGGDFVRFSRYADPMLEEREFFIRKAIGWILRETSKERPALVYEWLLPRAERASGVTMREAVRYLPPGRRAELMRAYEEGRRTSGASRRKRPRK